jgi:hypothetical protein
MELRSSIVTMVPPLMRIDSLMSLKSGRADYAGISEGL